MAKPPLPNSRPSDDESIRDDIANQLLADDKDFDGDNSEDEEDNELRLGDEEDDLGDDDSESTGDVDDHPTPQTPEKPKYPQDSKGNLVDANGRVIAKAGKERKEFEKVRNELHQERVQNVRLTKSLVELAKETKVLFDKYKQLKERKSSGSDYGLSDADTRIALEIAATAKVDAKTAIKKVLTLANLRGIDLSDLGVGGAFDPEEVAKHMIAMQKADRIREEKAAPKVQEPPKTDPDRERMQREVNAFLDRNPAALGKTKDGQPIFQLIAEAKVRFPHMTLDQIWQRMTEAARNGQKRQSTGVRPAANRQSNPRLNKRTGLSLDAVHPSKSYDDIAKDVLRDIRKLNKG